MSGDRELTCHHIGGASFYISSGVGVDASLWLRRLYSALYNWWSLYPCLNRMDLLLQGVPVLVGLILLLSVLGTAP